MGVKDDLNPESLQNNGHLGYFQGFRAGIFAVFKVQVRQRKLSSPYV